MIYSIFRHLALPVIILFSAPCLAQYPNACGSVNSRANSNGQPGNCAGVGATPVASNFIGTPYAAVPATAKTADITLKYSNVAAATLTPYAITRITGYVNGVLTEFTSLAGPAGVPTVTGSNDALVKYCIYTTNLPTAGQLIFELTNPETGVIAGSCTYDASCLSNCTPANIVMPLTLIDFRIFPDEPAVHLEWITDNEVDMSHFEIERSLNGVEFSRIGVVTASGTGGRNTYHFSDGNASKGMVNYFRLKMINKDGSYTYSITRTFRLQGKGLFVKNGGANPFTNSITLEIELSVQQEAIIELIDARGRAVLRKNLNLPAGFSKPVLNGLENISSGTYVLKITCGNESRKLQLVK